MFSLADTTRTPFFLSLALLMALSIAVSGESVKLIDKHCIEGVFVTVRDHPLELSSIVVGATLCAVNVLTI